MIAEYERAQIAERTRRGKRHRAKAGCVNVLCGAPYGYRYVKKSEHSQAYYEVVETQAEVVRKVFAWYTQELCSIGAITRQLNEQIPTRSGHQPLGTFNGVGDAAQSGLSRDGLLWQNRALPASKNYPPVAPKRRLLASFQQQQRKSAK